MALSAGPHTVDNPEVSAIPQVVAVAITQKPAHRGGVLCLTWSGRPQLELADRSLVIRHAQVLGPEFWSHADRISCRQADPDVPLVGPLGVLIDVDAPARRLNAGEQRLPEVIATVGNSAFAMHADTEAGNIWAHLEERCERITAVRCVRLRSQPFDLVVGVGSGPIVRV